MAHPSPSISIPTKADDGVDRAPDLSPTSPVDRKRMDSLLANRATPGDLQNKGILKGAPNDSLAARKMSLEKSMLEDRLDKELAARPTADELIKKGILNPNETPANASTAV
ncbi:uncharacterized protein EHS24_008935 [Apiotrichum porosum]|uniref:RPEL repeat protein n=1 Tax=Apiotrichum porosum TaxID=105984 RepID=A0A427XN61_9TREE|nr:uncharacterized protein EHS24_008935 [Apiotrichum porosum]RSH80359.1 hypothetical protein EHS24_008935 [Apiotrichum porosum]